PWSAIVDQDWISLGLQSLEFSHTDSTVVGQSIYTALSGRFGTRWSEWEGGAMSIYGLFGVRYEHTAFDAFGADGWQLDDQMIRQHVVAPTDLQVGHFPAERVLPSVGLGVRVGGQRFMSDFEICPLLAIVLDSDDHVYRHKVASALSTGGGVLLRLAPRLR